MNEQKYLDYKIKIIKVIEIFFPNAKIVLFGSQARGDYDVRSDFDIAIDIGTKMPITQKGQIISMIDALNIPQRVEIIDFHAIPKTMQDNIKYENLVKVRSKLSLAIDKYTNPPSYFRGNNI